MDLRSVGGFPLRYCSKDVQKSIRNPGLGSLSHSSHLQLHTTNVYIKGMQE